MKKPDRDRESVANAEIHQSWVLLKLGARALIDLHERFPECRSVLRIWVDHHERQHQAVWDELLGKVRASQILAPHPESPDDDTAERMLNSMRKATADLEQVFAFLRDVLQTRPERRDWAIRTVAELRKWVEESCRGFGQQLVATTYLQRLERLGKPEPIGVKPGEPVRPIEPPPVLDAEYEAWAAAHPEDRIDPATSAEDFIVKHRDGTVTRIRDVVGLYRKGVLERPWGGVDQTWDAALLEDLVLARACSVDTVTRRHLEWWLKPLQPIVEHLDRDSLPSAGEATLNRLMATTPMLITFRQHRGWIPTHRGREIVEDRLLPQWRRVTPDRPRHPSSKRSPKR